MDGIIFRGEELGLLMTTMQPVCDTFRFEVGCPNSFNKAMTIGDSDLGLQPQAPVTITVGNLKQ